MTQHAANDPTCRETQGYMKGFFVLSGLGPGCACAIQGERDMCTYICIHTYIYIYIYRWMRGCARIADFFGTTCLDIF